MKVGAGRTRESKGPFEGTVVGGQGQEATDVSGKSRPIS